MKAAAPARAASRPFEQVSAYSRPSMPAASQAESLAGQAPSELLSRAGRHGLLWSTTRAGS